MATIGTFTKNESGYAGFVRTFTVNAKIRFAPAEKEKDNAPDYRVLAGAAEAAYQQVDRLIAAAADQQRVRRNPVQAREPFDERPRLRLGIAVEAGA